MIKFLWLAVLGLVPQVVSAELLNDALGDLKGCAVGEQCTRELPGLTCADGTPAYYSVTLRERAENLRQPDVRASPKSSRNDEKQLDEWSRSLE